MFLKNVFRWEMSYSLQPNVAMTQLIKSNVGRFEIWREMKNSCYKAKQNKVVQLVMFQENIYLNLEWIVPLEVVLSGMVFLVPICHTA